MVRQIESDTPTRGVITYTIVANHRGPVFPPEEGRIVVGPYDDHKFTKQFTKVKFKNLVGAASKYNFYEKIEARYEQVEEWKVIGYEF